jgi:hypothetical protein
MVKKTLLSVLFAIVLSAATEGIDYTWQSNETYNTGAQTTAAKDFLSQFVSLFFGPYSNEPAIKINEPGDIVDDDGNWIWQPGYFTDGYGNVVYDVPYVLTIDESWMGWEFAVFADSFEIFTTETGSEPMIIALRFESITFSGGVFVLYEITNSGDEILQLGSKIYFHWGGPGPDFVRLAPLINEYGKIIACMFPHNFGFYAINDNGDFERLSNCPDGSAFRANLGYDAYTFTPGFLDGNFVPMVRMHELEQQFIEDITQRLRGTFTVVEGHAVR